jgi:predicted TIM-barrel fold metal-dependent hydrolase
MLIVDTHTHVFPDHLAYDTVSRMASKAAVTLHADGTLGNLRKIMTQTGIAYSATLPVATKPDQVESINQWVQANRQEGILSFGAIHPDYPHAERELKRLKELGFYGVKLHPDYQEFYPHEQKMYKIYEICQQLGLIVAFHCGDDIGYPRPGHSLPRLVARVHDQFPRLVILAAHFGGFEMWDQALKYLIGREIYIECSFTFGYIEPQRFYEIIKKHNNDLIMLGSDSPWGSIVSNIEGISTSSLTDTQKEKILGLNAQRLFGL